MPRNKLIQIRRDTSANWASVNPVLDAGEQGLETDTNKVKIGNGVTAWNSLDYFSPGRSVTATIGLSNADYKLTSANDHATFNTLFNALAAAGGGTVVLRKGTYTPIDNIVLRPNIELIFEKGAKMVLPAGKSLRIIAGGDNIVRNLCIDASAHGRNDKAVLISDNAGVGSVGVTFENPQLIDCGGFGIYTGAFSTAKSGRVNIINPMINGRGGNDLIGGGPGNSTGAVVYDVQVTGGGYIEQDATWDNVNGDGNHYANAIDLVAATRLRFGDCNIQGGVLFGSEQWPHVNSLITAMNIRGQGPFAYATSTLTSNNTNVTDGDTLTFSTTAAHSTYTQTYRFKNTPAQINDIKIGANADATLDNLRLAINGTGTAGTNYYTGTVANPQFTSSTVTAHAIVLTARDPSAAYNYLNTISNATTLTFSASKMTGGSGYAAQVGFILDSAQNVESHQLNIQGVIIRDGYIRLSSNTAGYCKNVVVNGVNIDAGGFKNGIIASNIDGLQVRGIVANASADGVVMNAVLNSRFEMLIRDCGGVGFKPDANCNNYDLSNSSVINSFGAITPAGFNYSIFNMGGANPMRKYSAGSSLSGNVTINPTNGHYQTLTLTGNVNLTVFNSVATSSPLVLEITNTTNSITWPANVVFKGAAPPIVNGSYTIGFFWDGTWKEAYRTNNATSAPTTSTDAATKAYVDSAVTNVPSPMTTYYIAANDSSARDKANADYVCDGTADQVEINTALDLIKASGGSVTLAAGAYNLSATISIVGNGNFADNPMVELIGAGADATTLVCASGISAITLTATPKPSIRQMKIYVLGSADGIRCIAPTTGANDRRGFWMGRFEDLKIQSDGSTHTGWAMNLENPFRSTFERIQGIGIKNGIWLKSTYANFNPGNLNFTNCHIDLAIADGTAYYLQSADTGGFFNICTFSECDAIDSNGSSTTSIGWRFKGSGTTYYTTRDILVLRSNVELFNTAVKFEHSDNIEFNGNFVNTKNNGRVFDFSADSVSNYVSVKYLYVSGTTTTDAILDLNAEPQRPNVLRDSRARVETGGILTATPSIATVLTQLAKDTDGSGTYPTQWTFTGTKLAIDSDALHKTGNETATGTKVFENVRAEASSGDALTITGTGTNNTIARWKDDANERGAIFSTNANSDFIVRSQADLVLTANQGGTSKSVRFGSSAITIADAYNISLNTTTGTKIGTATSQKLGFYNATPVVQPTATTELSTLLANVGLRATGTAMPITTTGAVQTGSLYVNGSLRFITGNVSASESPNIYSASMRFYNASAGNITVTLPSTTTPGYKFTFKKVDSSANTVTISGTIDGATNYVLSTQYKYVTLISTSVSDTWYVVGNN